MGLGREGERIEDPTQLTPPFSEAHTHHSTRIIIISYHSTSSFHTHHSSFRPSGTPKRRPPKNQPTTPCGFSLNPSRRAAAPSSLRTSSSLTALTLGLQQNDVGDQGAAALATLASTPRRVPGASPPASPKPRARVSSPQPSIFFFGYIRDPQAETT